MVTSSMSETEYDNIEIIGGTYLDGKNPTEQHLSTYYHLSEIKVVKKLLQRTGLKSFDRVVDLGCSVGVWLSDYKNLGFSKVVGIDISEDRLKKATESGYDETHCCNAYNLPFKSDSKKCIISNDVLVHVLQDEDKLRIFKEIKRVLADDGVFIFNFPNAKAYGYSSDTTYTYCRLNRLNTILSLLNNAGLKARYIMPAFFAIPRVGAHPRFAKVFSKYIFPFIDNILTPIVSVEKARHIYVAVTK